MMASSCLSLASEHSYADDRHSVDNRLLILYFIFSFQANLRQLDLSLLSELWTLSETMASWRRQLERGPRLRPAPPPPPPPHYLRT